MLFSSSKSDTHLVTLLKKDHEEVDKLFKELEAETAPLKKAALATQICQALTVHATVEEEVFYPPALQALELEKSKLIREAAVEHATLKGLIAALAGASPRDPMFDAQLTVLKEYVKHHVGEEENEIFPAVEKTDLDLEALGLQLQARKQMLEKRISERARPGDGDGTVTVIEFEEVEGPVTASSPARTRRAGTSSRAA
jgi:hemerythrin superfamily protein